MKKIKTVFSGNILFLLMILLTIISLSFTSVIPKEDSKIYWSKDKLLTWGDFKGKPIKASPIAADTDSGFELRSSYNSSDHLVVIELQTYFIKNKSWYKPEKKSENLLKHEQGHFDISELFTRKLHKNISEEKIKEKNISQKITELNEKFTYELHKYQDLYDKETEHSINEQKQKEWSERIAKELKEVEAYSETHFTVEVK